MTAPDTDDDDDLRLTQLAAGGPQAERAARVLFDRYYRRLQAAMVARFRIDDGTAKDLAQEALIRIFKSAAGFRRQAKLFTWLYQVASNLHLDQLKRPPVEQTVDDAQWDAQVTAASLRHEPGASERNEAFVQCFDRRFALFAKENPTCADAFQQVYFGRQPLRELARLLGISEDSTRQRMFECRKKLREFSNECLPFLD